MVVSEESRCDVIRKEVAGIIFGSRLQEDMSSPGVLGFEIGEVRRVNAPHADAWIQYAGMPGPAEVAIQLGDDPVHASDQFGRCATDVIRSHDAFLGTRRCDQSASAELIDFAKHAAGCLMDGGHSGGIE